MFASYMYIIGAENADLRHYVIITEFIGWWNLLDGGIQTNILGSTTDYTSIALALTIPGEQQKTLDIYRKFILRICGNFGPNEIYSKTFVV